MGQPREHGAQTVEQGQQGQDFARSKRPAISLPDHHPMVVLSDTMDWTEMETRAEKVRAKQLKNAAGRPPHLRVMLGALTLMANRKMPYRAGEEQIRYYAPARYLCGLTERERTPDFTTIQDFAQLLGKDGVRLINEGVVEQAPVIGNSNSAKVQFYRSPFWNRASSYRRSHERP
jgi:hypothetical protein